jgi:hypothetical protein
MGRRKFDSAFTILRRPESVVSYLGQWNCERNDNQEREDVERRKVLISLSMNTRWSGARFERHGVWMQCIRVFINIFFFYHLCNTVNKQPYFSNSLFTFTCHITMHAKMTLTTRSHSL